MEASARNTTSLPFFRCRSISGRRTCSQFFTLSHCKGAISPPGSFRDGWIQTVDGSRPTRNTHCKRSVPTLHRPDYHCCPCRVPPGWRARTFRLGPPERRQTGQVLPRQQARLEPMQGKGGLAQVPRLSFVGWTSRPGRRVQRSPAC